MPDVPIVDAAVLQVVDQSLLGLGAILLLAWLIHRFRTPVTPPLGAEMRSGRLPDALTLFWTLGAYVLAIMLGGLVVPLDPEAARQTGSTDWRTAFRLESGVRFAVAVGVLVYLATMSRTPAEPAPAAPRRSTPRLIAVAVAATLMITPVCYLLLQAGRLVWSALHPQQDAPIHDVLELLQNSPSLALRIELFVVAVVVAPLAEEVFFRGLLLPALLRHVPNAWWPILISAVGFGFIHAQPQDVAPLIALGVAFGYVRVRYDSLSACILMHALFNARTMVFALLNPKTITL